MSWRPEVGGFLTRILASIKRLGQDELGTEVVQLVLILPIVIGLLWSSFEIWQLMDLRSAVHSTAAQAARYISAYAAPPDEVDDPVLPEQIVWNIEQLIDNSLGGRRGILGSGLDWEINWYWIVEEIEQAGLQPRLVHPRKAKLMMGLINKTHVTVHRFF